MFTHFTPNERCMRILIDPHWRSVRHTETQFIWSHIIFSIDVYDAPHQIVLLNTVRYQVVWNREKRCIHTFPKRIYEEMHWTNSSSRFYFFQPARRYTSLHILCALPLALRYKYKLIQLVLRFLYSLLL